MRSAAREPQSSPEVATASDTHTQQAVQFKDQRTDATIQQKAFDAIAQSPTQLAQSQKTAAIPQANAPIQKKENKTGMSDQLLSGLERLSGLDMGDTRVHYNSDKPAQLNAHAYAQGTDIHIARGQEKHLAHEAWHVVQQKQGRVQPTRQMKHKTLINDDTGLEREADIMGAKAMQLQQNPAFTPKKVSAPTSTTAQLIEKDEVMDVYGLLPMHYQAHYMVNAPKKDTETEQVDIEDKTEVKLYLELRKIARLEANAIKKRHKEQVEELKAQNKDQKVKLPPAPTDTVDTIFKGWSKQVAKQKLIDGADVAVENAREDKKGLAQIRTDDKKSITKQGKVVEFSAPPFGRGKLEMISTGKSVLMFAAHGFTHGLGVSHNYYDEIKKYGFMSGKFDSVSRDNVKKENYVKMAQDLEKEEQKYKVKGVPDLVVFPHYGSDIIYEEGGFIDSLATDMDVAILIDWEWATNEKAKIMETAFVSTVPLTFILGSKPLNTYGNYLMQVCRAEWSRSAGVSGGSNRVPPKLHEW